MAEDNKEQDKKENKSNASVLNSTIDEEEDLLYTHRQKNDTAQMRWNASLCRKPGK
ncbi:MAG: hypothetical protein Q8J68_12420 [Methanolobus sp.]|uniref:hypothetical protein n=1 Tax=Methanolobus sp. TaxID=1874737 RepID=UPI002730A9D7|nr:hypothetical protein [Methanolobus sp.]MDP2218078.1 hypothetical protein [Methanolobus sp.]